MMLSLLALSGAFAGTVDNRFSAGLFGDAPPGGEAGGGTIILSDRMRAIVSESDAQTTTFNADLRLGMHLFTYASLDKSRVRAINFQIDRPDLQIKAGRFEVNGGGYRIADGIQLLKKTSERLQIGVWAGAAADPYSTLPHASFGGGPTFRYHTDALFIDGMMEVLGGGQGLDRVSIATTGRADVNDTVDLRWRVDLDYGGSAQPVHPNDVSVSLRARPSSRVQLKAFFDLYSAPFYLWSEKQDPSVKRFAARAQARDSNYPIPLPEIDHSVYTMAGASARVRFTLGKQRASLKTRLRYRYSSDPSRRFARVSGFIHLPTLFNGALDLSFEEAYLWWGGRPGTQSTLLAWIEPFEQTPISFDASLQVGTKRLEGETTVGLTNYADFYIDWLTHSGVMLSAGYAFSDSRDTLQWDPGHALYLRTSWNLKSHKTKANSNE